MLDGPDAEARRAGRHPPRAAATSRRTSSRYRAESRSPLRTLECRFLAKQADGTSAKFDCALADGRTVKVKYGRNPEIHAETLATRLLSALGFPADRVAIVPRLRCYGCPRFPFVTMQLFQFLGAEHLLAPHGYDDGYTDFAWVAVEARFPAPAIETPAHKGWGWFELDALVDASAADLGALRLLAVFLAHWDNKSDNQRLVCLDASIPAPAHRTARGRWR